MRLLCQNYTATDIGMRVFAWNRCTTTDLPQMHLETSSNFYGETVCPFNRKLTSGGSSGGEGALIGLKGTCMGIGTDIGVGYQGCQYHTTNRLQQGSIRSPAANNGAYGLRPTSYRLPLAGISATMLGESNPRYLHVAENALSLLLHWICLSHFHHQTTQQ
jgi:hypothetical protein